MLKFEAIATFGGIRLPFFKEPFQVLRTNKARKQGLDYTGSLRGNLNPDHAKTKYRRYYMPHLFISEDKESSSVKIRGISRRRGLRYLFTEKAEHEITFHSYSINSAKIEISYPTLQKRGLRRLVMFKLQVRDPMLRIMQL